MKQSSYKRELLASLEEIKKHNDKVKDEAMQCQALRIYGQGRHLLATRENTEQALNLIQSMYVMLRESVGTQSTGKSKWTPWRETRLTDILDVQKMEDLSRRLIAFESGQTDNPTNLNRPSKAMALEMARTLLELIHFDQGVTSSDTASYLRMGLSLDERPKARAAAMVTNDRFKAFMSDELASSALLVNGHADLASVEGISPLSFVSAEFVRIAESTGRAFVTKFFCGQHPPRYGQSFPPSPSRGLMASLVGQLVSQMLDKGVDVDLSFLSQSDWHDIYGLELSTLCSVFRELTNQLPAQSLLLCIIDEITQYETTALANDINVIFKKLTRLVKRREDIIFKLLVTAHSRAMRVSKHFVGQMLDLPEDIEADDSSGWHMTTMGDRREV